jgi:hypothetical protein
MQKIDYTYPILVIGARYEYLREVSTEFNECCCHMDNNGVLTVKDKNAKGFWEIIGVNPAP